MAGKQGSPIDAVRAIFEALEPLDDETRERAIASALSLLGIRTPAPGIASPQAGVVSTAVEKEKEIAMPVAAVGGRPVSLIEIMEEKSPATNPQRIVVFAFFRERVQGQPRFSRHDLERYFGDARLPPPANFDRDFNAAVTQGWIHEDADQSYLTTKGLEAVEAGFGGKRSSRKGKKPSSKKKPVSKKKTVKTRARRKPSTSKSKSIRQRAR